MPLSEAEREGWRRLWADVTHLLARATQPALAPPPREVGQKRP